MRQIPLRLPFCLLSSFYRFLIDSTTSFGVLDEWAPPRTLKKSMKLKFSKKNLKFMGRRLCNWRAVDTEHHRDINRSSRRNRNHWNSTSLTSYLSFALFTLTCLVVCCLSSDRHLLLRRTSNFFFVLEWDSSAITTMRKMFKNIIDNSQISRRSNFYRFSNFSSACRRSLRNFSASKWNALTRIFPNILHHTTESEKKEERERI